MIRRQPLPEVLYHLIKHEENWTTHQRSMYWINQIILQVRKDEQLRIRKAVLEYYAVAPKAAEPILKIIGGGVSE